MNRTFAMLFLLGISACGSSTPDLQGTWRTDCAPQTSNGMTSYLTYEISDATGVPRFTITSYADASCKTPYFALGNQSQRELGAPIAGINGAFEMTITYQKLYAIAYSDAARSTLSMSGCGNFTVGTEEDVSATGCLFLAPIAQCPQDYDIVKVDGASLYNGVRAGNQCVASGRPSTLNSFAFHRVN